MIDQTTTKQVSSTLIALCILTLIGSVLIILKGLLSYTVLIGSNGDRNAGAIVFINVIYLLEFLSCIGAIVGAIFMLSRKKVGFTIYLISSILYILLTTLFAMFCFFSIVGIPVGLLQFVYLAPSITFLVLYINQTKYLS